MADRPRVDAGRDALLRALQHAGVDFVLIGGAAIETHGERYRTLDVDITPQRSQANLQRLADVLNDLDCKLVVDVEDRAQDVTLPAGYFTAANLAHQSTWNLRTRHGDLDIPFAPAGFPDGYEQLRPRARQRRVADTSIDVPVAALDDIEHSKRTAARPKDVEYLKDVGRVDAPAAPARSDTSRSS